MCMRPAVWLRSWTLFLGVLTATAVKETSHAAGPEELRRGLVGHFRDPESQPPKGGSPVSLYRLEPSIALLWQEGETGHPRLQAGGGKVVWRGQLNLVRAGSYRFSVRLRGDFRLSVAGKEVLKAKVGDGRATLVQGPEVMLEAGLQPLEAEFTRLPGLARVELLWKGPGFREEPLPHDVVGHLPAEEPAQLKKDLLIEQGRFLAEELSCIKCHQVDEEQKVARTLGSRQAPDLSEVGRRIHPGWIERWLESPRSLRPGAIMPEMFSPDDLGKVERHAVARYLASLGGPLKPQADPRPKELPARSARGRALFASIGCIACHPQQGKGYPLSGMGSKTTTEQLARYLRDPFPIDPSGRMPNLLLKDSEAGDLAAFLCGSAAPEIGSALSATPAKEQLLTVLTRVDGRPDEKAAFVRLPVEQQVLDLGKRLVIDRGCNNCHTIAPEGKPFASVQANSDFKELQELARHTKGCLVEKKEQRGAAPWFGLSAQDREGLRVFLKDGLTGAGSAAPSDSARLDLKRFSAWPATSVRARAVCLPNGSSSCGWPRKWSMPR